ncbi:MAG: 4Fe-4S binding protein [Ardenticatenaceae bacterium]|nr:4Fe-4S binding protein [Ardenticatenaceae bacterium]MCB9443467.1 4Fe-4S binding protein [Ardenticatenaceae bacterium]
MNLLALAERWGEALATKPFGFAADRCLHAADKFATCTACYDICPASAIQPGKPPAFDVESCQLCRACLPVCPVGAFTADDEVPALLNCAERIGAKTVEVVCSLNANVDTGPAAAAVRVRGCLAGLGVGAYLGLVGQGLEKVVVRLDACADCPWSQLRSQVESQIQQAQGLLALWERAETLACVDVVAGDFAKRPFWNATSPPMSRRSFFSWRENEKKPAAASPSAVDADPNPFHQRLHLLRAVKQMPAATSSEQAMSGFALLAVNDDCTACGVCARVCPTGALQMETAKSSYQLTFSPQICIACDVCSHVCAPNTITLTHDPTFEQVFGTAVDQIVQQGELAKCSKCHAPFAAKAGTDLCPVCEFRRQNPFGSAMPPGLALHQTKKNLTGARRITL